MKTKVLALACLISLGLIAMSFTTEKETVKQNQTEQQTLITDINVLYDDVKGDIIIGNKIRMTNYPDPFLTRTTIEYELVLTTNVFLLVENADGTETLLVNGTQERGVHKVLFNAKGKKAGKYVARLITDYSSATEVMTKKDLIQKDRPEWIWD